MISFTDLRSGWEEIEAEIMVSLTSVLKRGWYILGEELEKFEKEFAKYLGSKYAVGVNSGSDSLLLALKALNIGEGDEVITVPFTFMSTVDAITRNGARPVFIDIEPDSFLMDVTRIEEKITSRTKAILPVHLFGNSLAMSAVQEIVDQHNLKVIEDACQAHGAEYRGRKVGSFGAAGCFSFYPTKNLGAVGDAGVVVTDDSQLADKLKRLRDYGRVDTHTQESLGINSRLDEIQAAVLRVKLQYLDCWNERRKQLAQLYSDILRNTEIMLPSAKEDVKHVFHRYVIRVKERDRLREYLEAKNIQTLIHYPLPVHLQPTYRFLGYKKGNFPAAEACAGDVLSLPLYPGLEEDDVTFVATTIKDFVTK